MPQTQITISTQFQGTGAAAAKVALGQVGAEASKAEKQLLAYATATAAAQRRQGDAAGSVRTLTAAINQVAPGTRQAIAAEGQLAAALAAVEKQAKGVGDALPRTFAGITKAGAGALGALGLVSSIPQLVSFGIEAGKTSLELDRTMRLTKELTGTQAGYNQVIAAAKTQQELYGGSLQENIAGIQGLVVTARSTGAELTTLIDLSKRLAVLDPAQGAEGARIALSEVLSGDPRSLSRRYEIPLSALNKIKDEATPVAERLKILDQYLTKIGITSGTVNNVVTEQAKIYNRLGAAADNAKVKVGSLIAEILKAPAQNLTISLNRGDDVAAKKGELGAGAADAARTFGQYQQAVKLADQTLLNTFGTARGFKVEVDALSQAQFDYVKSLQSQGVATTEAIARAQGLKPVFDGIIQAQQRFKDTTSAIGVGLATFSAQILRVAASGDVGRAGAVSLNAAYVAGQLTTEQYQAALLGLEAQHQRNAEAASLERREEERLTRGHTDATGATLAYISTLQASAAASIEDAAKKDAQGAATALLAEKNRLAVDTFLALNPTISGSAAASLAAAAGYTPQIQRLIVLAAAARDAKNALGALNGAGAVAEGRSERDRPADLAAAGAVGAAAARERAAAAEKARQNQSVQTGSALQVVRVRQQQYNEAVKQFGKNSAQAIDAQTNLIQAQQSADKKDKSGRISAAESTALSLNDIARTSGDDRLRIERENLERLRDQQDDFDIKNARSKEDYERQRRRLLAEGKRFEAAQLAETFAREQKRGQEDFDRDKRRTIRNNTEALGDQSTKVENRVESVNARAAAKGVAPSAVPGVVGSAGDGTPLPAGSTGSAAQSAARVFQMILNAQVTMDSKQVGMLVYDTVRQQLETDFVAELIQSPQPGSGQTAIAGSRP